MAIRYVKSDPETESPDTITLKMDVNDFNPLLRAVKRAAVALRADIEQLAKDGHGMAADVMSGQLWDFDLTVYELKVVVNARDKAYDRPETYPNLREPKQWSRGRTE